jgi:hypothetical protein
MDLCLDYNTEDDEKINLYMMICHDKDSQQFTYDGMTLKSKSLNKCLDYSNQDFRAHVVPCVKDEKSQHWNFEAKVDESILNTSKRGCMAYSPPQQNRQYSSVFQNSAVYTQSELESPLAWVAQTSDTNQWLQMDLGSMISIGGTVTQGRANTHEMVQTYKVKLSSDGQKWIDVPGTFDGNTDDTTQLYGLFTPKEARYVRIFPESWSAHISIRAGVLVCAHPEKLQAQQKGPALASPDVEAAFSNDGSSEHEHGHEMTGMWG